MRVDEVFGLSLLERQPELDLVADQSARVKTGEVAVMMFSGSPGYGKTRLLQEIRRTASGITVLSATGHEAERDVEFGTARQLFSALSGAKESVPWLFAEQAVDAGDGTPGARREHEWPASGLGGQSPYAIRALTRLVAEHARQQPVLLCLDDVHESDTVSLLWLDHLVQQCRALMVVLTSVADRSPTPPDTLEHWANSGRSVVRVLSPLSADATQKMIREVLGDGDAEFSAECHRLTAGNPALLRALLYRLADQDVTPDRDHLDIIPGGLETAMATRVVASIRQCRPATVTFARVAAALGDGADVARAARVAGIGPLALEDVRRDLACADLADEVDGAIQFRYPLSPRAVIGTLPQAQRAELHEKVARELNLAAFPAEKIAWHLIRSRAVTESWMAERLCEAAEVELQNCSLSAAETYFRLVLNAPVGKPLRQRALLGLGAALSPVAPDQAAHYLRGAFATMADSRSILEVALTLPGTVLLGSQPETAVAVFDELKACLGADEPDAAEMLEAHRLLIGQRFSPPLGIATGSLPVADGSRPATSTGQRAKCGVHALSAAMYPGSRQQAAALAEQALVPELLSPGGLPAILAAAVALMHLERLAEARFWLQRVAEASRRNRAPLLWATAVSCSARCAHQEGNLADAAAAAKQMLAMVSAECHYRFRMYALPTMIRILVEQNKLREASALAAGPFPASSESSVEWDDFLHARGILRFAHRDLHGCLDDLLECGRRQAARQADNPIWVNWRPTAVRAFKMLGHLGAARELAQEGLESARRWGSPLVTSSAIRAAVLVADQDETTRLEEAVQTLDGSPAKLELACALIDLGTAQNKRGHRKLARETLHRALDYAQTCEAWTTVEWAHRQLLAAGARPQRVVSDGVRSLTSSERQVASMAAEGLTNREIADRLWVTQRTVEAHLSRVYRKSGIQGRSELAAALGVASETSSVVNFNNSAMNGNAISSCTARSTR